MNGTLRVGLVGCGYWGSKHLRVLHELPNCEVAALCEPSQENIARQPGAFLPSLITADYDHFLSSEIDAVVLATPARTHYDLAARALTQGKHVLVEKPFTTSSAKALALIDLAERAGLTLAVGHTYVYHPAVEFLRSLVQSGRLGAPRYVHTARLNFGLLQPDVDALWDLAPHDLSILLHVFQEEPVVTGARGTAVVGPEHCEVVHLDLEFPSGPSAHVYVSWLEPVKVRRLTFVGEDRTVVYDDVAPGEQIRVFDKSIRLSAANGDGAQVPHYANGDITVPLLPEREPLKTEITDFLDSIRTGLPARSNAWEGLRVVRLIETARQMLYDERPGRNGAAEGLFAPLVAREPAP